MADIAVLGIKVENGEAVKATASLNQLAVAGGKAEIATQKMSRRMGLAQIEAQKMDAALDASARSATRAKLAFGAMAAVAAVGFIGRETIKNTLEAQAALAQLEAAVASTGGAAGRSVPELQAFAAEMQRTTAFGDDAVVAMQSLLLTFTKIAGPEFDAAQRAIADMATRMGGDLQGATILVGKALQDPIKGMASLSRAGVQFSEDQKAVIKALIETGQQAEAQRIILKELETQFGGSAIAARDTLGGALAGLKNAWGDLFELTKDGTQGSVDAINAITNAMSNSGLSMGKWLTQMALDWAHFQASLEKTAATLRLIGEKDYFAKRKAAHDKIDYDLSVRIRDILAPAKTGSATAGAPATLGGGGAAAEGMRIANAAREAKREADRARQAKWDAEDAAERKAQEYADDLKDIWASGMIDIVQSTERGFGDILDSIGGFVKKMIQRMAQEGQSSRAWSLASAGFGGAMAGYNFGGMFTNRGAGGLAGAGSGAMAGFSIAGPAGAAVGALTGFIGGILGAGNAAKEAAARMADLRASLQLNFEAMEAMISGDQVGVNIAQAKAYFEEQRRLAREANPLGDLTRAARGSGAQAMAWAREMDARAKAKQDEALAKINEQERRRIDQLTKEGDALDRTTKAGLNMVAGYKTQARIFEAMQTRNPTGTNPGWAGSGPITSATSGNLTVNLVIDGTKIGSAVLKDFKNRKGRGDSGLAAVLS